MNNLKIGRISATEKNPTSIDEFFFWTSEQLILNPFDVIKVEHINDSTTYGVIEEIFHITDSNGYLSSYISNDFGDVDLESNTERISMNYVKAKVIGNSKNIYNPVLNSAAVSLATSHEVEKALGFDTIKNPLVCGYLEMYENATDSDKVSLPIPINSDFLIGPEGAHLNISGISGLAAKTSYAMFLMKAIQVKYLEQESTNPVSDDSVAFIFLNVKGKDLLAIDEKNIDLEQQDIDTYEMLNIDSNPFCNVNYLYPYSKNSCSNTYADNQLLESQIAREKAKFFKYIFKDDRENIDLLFSNIDDPSMTMESIIDYIISEQGDFKNVESWKGLRDKVDEYGTAGNKKADKEITVSSWRKFKRIISKATRNSMFSTRIAEEENETSIKSRVLNIKKNEVLVVDIAKLDETMQSFVFGDVIRNVYDLKLGVDNRRDESEIPSKVIIFIDELNKYASRDIPKNSPILRQLIDIAERGRSLGIILFSAEQFRSAIHERVTGNSSTHAYGRTNAIEISKKDYQYIPNVYKSMMTRLKQGEYIIQNPVFRSVLKIKFPKPVYRQFK